MIDSGFKLTADDTRKLNEFKISVAYGTYLKAIKASPIYSTIVREYVKNVDIKADVTRLQSDGHLPDGVSADTLNNLFKQSISRMAINMVADTVILVELEQKRVDDVIHDIRSDADIMYLLGTADEKYYKEAEKLLEKGKLDQDTVTYRGLVNWHKLKEKLPRRKNEELVPMPIKAVPIKESATKEKKFDLDSLDIDI